MTDTDYKRLWKNARKNIVGLSNIVFELQQQIEAQVQVLRDVRDGLIKPDDIFGEKRVTEAEKSIAFIKKQMAEMNLKEGA